MQTTYKTKNWKTIQSFWKYNQETWNFEKDWKTVKFMGESHRRSLQSIDLYNVMMTRIKDRNDRSPERWTMCDILRDRGETQLLCSLLVNA